LWKTLESDNPQALAQEAHRTRGVAANLGMHALATALADLERDGAGEAVTVAIGRLEEALAAIRALAPFAAAAVTSSDPQQPLAGAASVLARALARGAIDDAALATLDAGWSGPAASLHELQEAIRNFDFDRARAVLADMASHLPPQEST
jgi:HPt (histidine-containing phosphotransfer) domain-containing protein